MPRAKKTISKETEKALLQEEVVITQTPKPFSYTPILMGLLVICAFVIGFLVNKVMFLQSGGSVPVVATNLDGALKNYAKEIKLNAKIFAQCLGTNKYKDRIDKDTAYGQTLGIQGTPAFFINGKLVGGAFPYVAFKEILDKELSGTASANIADYSETLKNANTSGAFKPEPVTIALGDAPVRGDTKAPVTIVEFSDFQCPFCSRAVPTVDQVMKDYKGKVKLVYKQFPLTSIHPNAYRSALASECAKEQGKFWEMHDLLFKNQTAWSTLPQVTATP